MKFDLKYLALLLTALIAGEFYFVGRDDAQTKALLEQVSDTYETSLRLEKEIGYGGLIHNFKNAVLRPTETKYAVAAEANAVNAFALIDALETHAKSFDLNVQLNETRAVVRAYQQNISVAASMLASGAATTDVDKRVRINDEFALREITDAAEQIETAIRLKLIKIRNASAARLVLVFFLFSGGLVYTALTLRKSHRQAAEIRKANIALESANKELERTNSDLGRTNDDLERSNVALRQFAGIAAHDLRSPVRQIALMADMMPKDGEDPSKVAYFSDEIRSAAVRLDQSVASLLDFSKTGFQRPHLQRVDPYVLIEDVVRDLAAPIESLGAIIQTENLPQINADPELLKRVFQNLIENSLRYAHEDRKPEIIISATGGAHAPIFSVADNGIGIDPVHAERIFLPMQRLHDRHDKYEGVGIGLSLVKSIVEAHGGGAWLDTERVTGARICFTLQAAGAKQA